jgi:hypothetical protein
MKQYARLLLAIGLCIAAAALSSTPAYAQGGRTSTSLSGTVTDASGAVIPGATVAVKNNATATEFHATTNESGSFTVPSVDPGGYTVTVTLMGFKTAVINDVRISAGTPTSVKVALEVGGLEETVVVQGGSEIIQTQSPAVTSVIDANQILKLPTGSRSALEFVTTLPGINTPGGSRDSTVNGLPQSSINMTLDGVSVQDNHLKTGDGFFARVSPRLDAIEEVTVSTAAQDAASTGQGAVQIRFITRSGSNQFSGSSYYYMQHYKLNSNTWFNNRDLPPGPNGKAPKAEDVLYQPGTRVGGPIVIPGLFNGRDKAFFFVNYEESRSPGQGTAERNILHPRAQEGFFRYTASGVTREVNVLQLAAANGQLATLDPTVQRLLADIRSTTGAGGVADLTDPMLQRFTFQYETKGVTKYPTGRVDYNVTSNHRLTWSMNYTDLVSTPDTTNDREPKFPGFPSTGPQISDRYTVQGTLRSTLGANLVNELRIGGSGGATLFQPNMAISQFQGTSIGDQAGFLLNINRASGIQNAAQTGAYSAREASTKLVENTLNWLKGNHSIQTGFQFTQGDVWLENQLRVRSIDFGVDAADPANGLFNTTNFSGASNAQLTQARNLYAVLTGRVTSVTGELRLDEASDEYVFGGTGLQRARLRDLGFFLADTWRWKPNLTLNLGLRYELQLPFYPNNNSYSKASVEDVWGVSGVGNLFQPGVMTGRTPQYVLYEKGEGAYNSDLNNWAPSVGFAYTMGGSSNALLGSILGRQEGDSVIRGGFTMGYNRPGMSDFTGAIDDNPGIAQTANRNHALGNLGTPGSILLRNTSDLGPPPNMPVTRNYPLTDVVTGDVTIFDENLQVPYAMTWTAGWQRKLTADTVVEARYVGTRSLQGWNTFNYNEINIVENNFLNEFRQAQANLTANIAAGRGNTFAFTGAPGTAPLPIFLAHYNGQPQANATDPARYTGNNWTNSTFLGFLAQFNPQPFSFASTNATNGLLGNATFRNNAATAGLARNFWVANPDLIGGANIISNGGYTKYNSLQMELRKRLSHGLQFNTSYTFGRGYLADRYSFRRDRREVLDVGAEGSVDHSLKATWVYELPFGRGRRFGGNSGGFMDRVIGGWSFDGVARIQSGRLLSFGNVRLVGMTAKDVEDMFELRFDDAGKQVFMLPADVIANTVKAFSVTPTGYSAQGAPEGRYFAPPNGPDCIEVAQTAALTGYGDCGINNLVVRGPKLYRFDLSAEKRIPVKGRVNFIFRAEFLNAFNTPWFTPVTGIGNDPDDFLVDSATSGRDVQLVFRVNW